MTFRLIQVSICRDDNSVHAQHSSVNTLLLEGTRWLKVQPSLATVLNGQLRERSREAFGANIYGIRAPNIERLEARTGRRNLVFSFLERVLIMVRFRESVRLVTLDS
jgi:hypothetical protein